MRLTPRRLLTAAALGAFAVALLGLLTKSRRRPAILPRSAGRYPIVLDVECRLLDADRVGRGKTLNISAAGILFKANLQLPIGGVVELSIKWPFRPQNRGLILFMRGRVVRVDPDTGAVAIKAEYHQFRLEPFDGVTGTAVA